MTRPTERTGFAAPLDATHRAAALADWARDPLDVLVVGGGVVGAGVALDAASRGLRVGLVEAGDLGSGTSSRSSKLVHGGLRYLEMLQFGLVAEALAERGRLHGSLAPHLVQSVPFLYPLTHRGWERPYVGAGVWLYDRLAARAHRHNGSGQFPRHRHLSRSSALALAPALRPDTLTGAVQYHDAQVDDARLVLTLARTALQHGAGIATGCRVRELSFDAAGRAVGAVLADADTGTEHVLAARHIILASGVWTPELLAGTPADGAVRVRASKGVHLLVPRRRIEAGTGFVLRTATSVLFVIPWGENWLVGTTDTDHAGDLEQPVATSADVDYLLAQANTVLADPLRDTDVVAVYAGLRPLVDLADPGRDNGRADRVERVSREHLVASAAPGLSVVAGGKLTTYRVMAADAVDVAAADLADQPSAGDRRAMPASRTAQLPLTGATGHAALAEDVPATAADWGVDVGTATRLLGRYGSLTAQVLAPATARPELREVVPGTGGYLAAELLYAVTHEGARRLDDILERRTRVAVETVDGGLAAAEPTARLVAPVLGWDSDRVHAEVARYRKHLGAERQAQRAERTHGVAAAAR